MLLLENLRFHAAEEANDKEFAGELAGLGDIYVNDAFSCAHRAHASTEAIAHLLPSAAGRLMQEELDHLSAALEKPQRPVMALVGGAKVSTKLDLLGEYSLTRRLALFANLRNVRDISDRGTTVGPATPAHATLRFEERYGSLWTLGVKGTF